MRDQALADCRIATCSLFSCGACIKPCLQEFASGTCESEHDLLVVCRE